jgi:hypothetical protein
VKTFSVNALISLMRALENCPNPRSRANERDVATLHSIIAMRFRAALMTRGELFLGEESFRERLDKRRGN